MFQNKKSLIKKEFLNFLYNLKNNKPINLFLRLLFKNYYFLQHFFLYIFILRAFLSINRIHFNQFLFLIHIFFFVSSSLSFYKNIDILCNIQKRKEKNLQTLFCNICFVFCVYKEPEPINPLFLDWTSCPSLF